MKIDWQDKRGEAMARGRLSLVYMRLGELEKAEAHAHRARDIMEGLIRELPLVYYTLAQLAHARGDEAQAAPWEAKGSAVGAEPARHAGAELRPTPAYPTRYPN